MTGPTPYRPGRSCGSAPSFLPPVTTAAALDPLARDEFLAGTAPLHGMRLPSVGSFAS